MTIDYKAAIKGAKRPERVVPLCLRGDLVSEIEELDQRLTEINAANRDNMTRPPEAKQIAQRIAELQEEMRKHTFDFRIRGRSEAEWSALVADHEMREGFPSDEAVGYNSTTMPRALVRACLVPEPSDDEWAGLTEALTMAQFEQLWNAAIVTSKMPVSIPKSRAASATLRRSDAT